MKTLFCFAIIVMALWCSCNGGGEDYDASGVFETTEVTVSAQGAGEIRCLEVEALITCIS